MTPFASVPRRTIEFETATTSSAGKGPPGRPGELPEGPGLRGHGGTSEGETEEGNRVKGEHGLNTKGGLGTGSMRGSECPGSGAGLLWAEHPSEDGDEGGLWDRTGWPRWRGGMALPQPHCVRQMRSTQRRPQLDGFCCGTWLAGLMSTILAFIRTAICVGRAMGCS